MFGDYDEDLSDPKQRCKHGIFIGSWAGPDYLCGYCELGYDPDPMEGFWFNQRRRKDRANKIKSLIEFISAPEIGRGSFSQRMSVIMAIAENAWQAEYDRRMRDAKDMKQFIQNKKLDQIDEGMMGWM